MRLPKKALVLAAGMGTRMRPLTSACPKPLLPLWNLPMIERTLRMLEDWGVRSITVNLHWRAERLKAYLAGRRGAAKITLSEEKEILGTGGALRPLRAWIGDDPFWVVNGDVACSLIPDPFLEALEGGEGFAAAWLEPDLGPRTVEMDRKGRITCYHSPDPGLDGNLTFCGVSLLTPEVLRYLPETPFCTLVDLFEAAMADSRFVNGVVLPGSYWADAGTVERYLQIHAETKKRARRDLPGGELYDPVLDRANPQSDGFFAVAPIASVPKSVRGENSVVLGRTVLGEGCVVRDSVIAGGEIGPNVRLEGTVCVAASTLEEPALERVCTGLGWPIQSVAATCLGQRGSDRTFWRLRYRSDAVIAIAYRTEARPENGRYASHTRLLEEAGVAVPKVRFDDPASCCQAFDDLGDESLQALMADDAAHALDYYLPVMRLVARLHTEGARRAREAGAELEPAFDEALYAWERDLFERHLLKARYGFNKIPAKALRELKAVSKRLAGLPDTLVHRDLQSSNLLRKDGVFSLIDFQGMRWGPSAYDLASLLFDPYVALPEAVRQRLAEAYLEAAPEQAESVAALPYGAVQRLIQALGAYGRLASVGQTGFTRHIIRALRLLLEAADACGLEAVGALAEELIPREELIANLAERHWNG